MVRRQFQPTEGLLEDVMRKQAGSVEKAILEAVMNSVDANAESVNIVIEEDAIVIEDDGDGMTEEEVEEYFEKFGLKDDDIEEKDFGKFRMGRGQIFNFGKNVWHSLDNIMVVDLDHDETELDWGLVDDVEESDVKRVVQQGDRIVLDTSGLSYNWAKASSNYDGCRILVIPYQNVLGDEHDVTNTIEEVESLIRYIPWVHGVEIHVNGEEVYEDPDPDFDTDQAWFNIHEEDYGSTTSIYNQGALVKTERLTRTKGEIITKVDLDVNFARNDILETDQNWNRIVEEYQLYTVEILVETERLSRGEKKWLLEKAASDPQVFEDITDIPLFEDTTGRKISLRNLQGEKFSFAPRGDKLAEFAMERTGAVVLSQAFEENVRELHEEGRIVEYSDLIEKETKWEMSEYDYNDLSSRRQENFDRAEWFLEQVGYDGEIRPGYSMHADAWKNDQEILYIDKSFLKQPKMDFILMGLVTILEIACQSGDTRYGLEYGIGFKDRFWGYSQDMGEYQKMLIDGEAP